MHRHERSPAGLMTDAQSAQQCATSEAQLAFHASAHHTCQSFQRPART